MEFVSISSSAISEVGYDEESEELAITFTSGSRYMYHGVPASIYNGLLSASSAGKYFNKNIAYCFDFARLN